MEQLMISNLADIKAIEKTPLEQRLKATNTYEMIKKGAEINPNNLALSFLMNGEQYASPIQITYKEFLANVNRSANLFHSLGIEPHDVISYLLPNIPQTHYVLWGGEATGIVNPINPMLEAEVIRDICLTAGTKVIVALGEYPGSDIWPKVMAIKDDLPGLKAIVRVMGPSDKSSGILGFEEVLGNYDGTMLTSKREIKPDDICSLYHTGGTTGTPKLAPHTHYNEVVMAAVMDCQGLLKTGETVLCGLPLFHVNATMITGGMPFSIGAHVVLMSPQGYRDPTVIQNFYRIVEHYQASFFSSVPTVLSALLDAKKGDADISTLRFALCGAAPLSVELMQRFETYTNVKVMEGYGLTEGTTVSSVNPAYGERRTGSIGLRIPYTEMNVFIREEKGIRKADVDEIGTICIKGPTVFNGYLDERKNQDIWMKEGWLDTGDLGRQDADGYFWLTGRKKDLIIRGGHNIDPAVIEEPLYRLDGIQVAAAVGKPDSHAGEVPVAFVQIQKNSDLTSDSIIKYLKQEIGERAAIPKDVFIIDKMPLTPVGKIFKPFLKWESIGYAYKKEIEALGSMIQNVDVAVGEDKVHGSIAQICIRALPGIPPLEVEQKVKTTLSRHTIKYNLKIE